MLKWAWKVAHMQHEVLQNASKICWGWTPRPEIKLIRLWRRHVRTRQWCCLNAGPEKEEHTHTSKPIKEDPTPNVSALLAIDALQICAHRLKPLGLHAMA